MARTAPISGPLSFLIVALAAVFLHPGLAERGGVPVASPAAQFEETGPPRPADNPAQSAEIPILEEDAPVTDQGEATRETASVEERGAEGGVKEG